MIACDVLHILHETRNGFNRTNNRPQPEGVAKSKPPALARWGLLHPKRDMGLNLLYSYSRSLSIEGNGSYNIGGIR
jgi:hypothetical protein